MIDSHAIPMHFHAGHNEAGCLPESDVATFATFEDAKTYMIGELLHAANQLAPSLEPHECEDQGCGGCPEQLANAHALLAEELSLESGPDWQGEQPDGRHMPVSWWIMSCEWPDCAYHDPEEEPAHDYPVPLLPSAAELAEAGPTAVAVETSPSGRNRACGNCGAVSLVVPAVCRLCGDPLDPVKEAEASQ